MVKMGDIKIGSEIQFRVDSLAGHGYLLGQVWGEAGFKSERPTRNGRRNADGDLCTVTEETRGWWVVTASQEAYFVELDQIVGVLPNDEDVPLFSEDVA